MIAGQTTLEDAGLGLGPRVIDRPEIGYDDDAHAYTLDRRPVPGVSTVAKIGSDLFSPGAWWGFGLTLDGLGTLSEDELVDAWRAGELRGALRERGWDPNQKRDRAADRGNSVHDALERLAQDGTVPDPKRYPEEERGHVLSLLRWYLHYRPEFEATEVIVGSREHGFAGRYDLRLRIDAGHLALGQPGKVLGLVDLKTSKSVYPEQHFAQLGGYEVASREIGYAPTDFQAVLRTSEDGSFTPWDSEHPERWADANFVPAWGDPQALFLAYLGAYNVREATWYEDPKRALRREEAIRRDAERAACLDALPGTSREVAAETGLDAKVVSRRLQDCRKAGLATCEGRTWKPVV